MILASTMDDVEIFSQLVQYNPGKNFKGIKLIKDGVVEAMAGYDHWTPNSVNMHMYVRDPKSITRAFVREVFRFPFEIGGRGLVIGVTPSDNAAALDLNKHVGFRETYRVKDGWDVGVDMVVQEMRKEECRWLRRAH